MSLVLTMILVFAAIDPTTACKDAKDTKLCAELLAIRERDQDVRNRWIADLNNEAIKAEVAKVDQEDLARVEQIIAKYGYPGKSLVGKPASGAAWIVLQHSDLAAQKKYIDLLQKAADAGELDPGLVATMIDRIRTREGRPQIYGTQFHEVNGTQVPFPIEDEVNVDARRAKVGLGTLAENAKHIADAYKTPAAVSPLIARVWRGRVPTARADEYQNYLNMEGIQRIRAIPSNVGVQMFRRTIGDVTEFVVISYWPSRAAIREFAGEDIEKASFLPRDREFLINPDEFVQHFEVQHSEWAPPKK